MSANIFAAHVASFIDEGLPSSAVEGHLLRFYPNRLEEGMAMWATMQNARAQEVAG